jgi:hypothetical protein
MTPKRTSEDSMNDLLSCIITELRANNTLMKEGFEKLNSTMETGFHSVKASLENIDHRLGQLEGRIDLVNANIAADNVNEASRIETTNRIIAIVDRLTTRN